MWGVCGEYVGSIRGVCGWHAGSVWVACGRHTVGAWEGCPGYAPRTTKMRKGRACELLIINY